MQDRMRWVLAIIIVTFGTILFVLGWTLPFAALGWWSHPLVDISFSVAAAMLVVAGLLLVWKSGKDSST